MCRLIDMGRRKKRNNESLGGAYNVSVVQGNRSSYVVAEYVLGQATQG